MSLGRFIDLKRYCCEHTAALSHCIYRNYAVMVIYVEHCRLMSPSLADNCRTYSVIIIVWLSKLCEHRYCCGDSVDNMGFCSFLKRINKSTLHNKSVSYKQQLLKVIKNMQYKDVGIDVNAFTPTAPWTQNSTFKECLEFSLIFFCYSYRSIQRVHIKIFWGWKGADILFFPPLLWVTHHILHKVHTVR